MVSHFRGVDRQHSPHQELVLELFQRRTSSSQPVQRSVHALHHIVRTISILTDECALMTVMYGDYLCPYEIQRGDDSVRLYL